MAIVLAIDELVGVVLILKHDKLVGHHFVRRQLDLTLGIKRTNGRSIRFDRGDPRVEMLDIDFVRLEVLCRNTKGISLNP